MRSSGAEARTFIHRGPKSMVYHGPRPGLVTKIYRDTEVRGAREAAEVEFEFGTRVHELLSELPEATCPRPVAIVREGGGWGTVLEEVHGRSLLSFLYATERPDYETVGAAIAVGVSTICRSFGKPVYGLKPQDILWDGDRGRIVLLDFEPAGAVRWAGDPGERSPVAASFGILLGRSLHYLTAPSRLGRRSGRRWLLDVIGLAAGRGARSVGGFSAADTDILTTLAHRACRRRGRQWTIPTAWRPTWYELLWWTVGRGGVRRVLKRIQVEGGLRPRI